MKKVLFFINNLAHGGAEKVLVNLVNAMDKKRFDVTVMTLFDEGVNKADLCDEVKYRFCFKRSFKGNSHILKLFSPRALYKMLVKDSYDIVISYLEGTAARIISGCDSADAKKIAWIHTQFLDAKTFSVGFRSYAEARRRYLSFDAVVGVSGQVAQAFDGLLKPSRKTIVLYNTNDSEAIIKMSAEAAPEIIDNGSIKLIGVGKVTQNKGFDRLARIHKRLCEEGFNINTYILGTGPDREKIERYLRESNIEDSFIFLGYKTNPYKYVAKCDLFVCSSHREGFSTAATEALIAGTPVITTDVSGMKEMLGENGEFGIITENNEDALYDGLKKILSDNALLMHYRAQAKLRGSDFSAEKTVAAVEEMLENL